MEELDPNTKVNYLRISEIEQVKPQKAEANNDMKGCFKNDISNCPNDVRLLASDMRVATPDLAMLTSDMRAFTPDQVNRIKDEVENNSDKKNT